MEIKKIKELIKILENSGLEELELKDKNGAIRLVKTRDRVMMQTQVPMAPPAPVANPAESPSAKEGKDTDAPAGEVISSPMVGTFYRSPSPNASPFVKEGDKINAGDVVCIIEAMKTMNKIKSDKSGKIRSVLVEDRKPVEFGQELFSIE